MANVTPGKLPDAIMYALGGQSIGGGAFTVNPAVAVMVRAFGGAAAGGGSHPGDNILLESGDNILLENGTDAFQLE